MKLFKTIKDQIHDASGVKNPNLYWWEKSKTINVYYPVMKLTDNEILLFK